MAPQCGLAPGFIAIAGEMCRTIAWTKAASLCGVIELVNNSNLPAQGFTKQESINLDNFLAPHSGRLYAGLQHGGKLINKE